MDAVIAHLPQFAVAGALAWASGMRLYLVLFVVGLLGRYAGVSLPEELQILSSPLVLLATGFMVVVESTADKIPLVDSAWDAIHTFIRIPGGAMLAAAMAGDSAQGATVAAAVLGGTLAASSHFAKAGTRAVINTSPEPFSNWAASFSEEGMVLGGLWLAFNHPVAFIAGLLLFLAVAIWVAKRLWIGLRRLLRRWEQGPPIRPRINRGE